MIRKRAGWLCTLLVLQILTIGVLSFFEGRLSRATILVVFIPLIISSGGNTGTQAASLLIRALAVREVELADWRRVIRREVTTGAALGVLLGALAFALVYTIDAVGFKTTDHAALVGGAVALSVFAIVLWGVAIGAAFPMILHRAGLDPATISSPLVATLMDVSGLVIYFAVAAAMLSGTLL